ncbi:MAG: hypothetical protein ACRD0S_13665 [Acidimicrobiales bacterium]
MNHMPRWVTHAAAAVILLVALSAPTSVLLDKISGKPGAVVIVVALLVLLALLSPGSLALVLRLFRQFDPSKKRRGQDAP